MLQLWWWMYWHFPCVCLDLKLVAVGYKECIFIIFLVFSLWLYINPPLSKKKLVNQQLTLLRFMKVRDRILACKSELQIGFCAETCFTLSTWFIGQSSLLWVCMAIYVWKSFFRSWDWKRAVDVPWNWAVVYWMHVEVFHVLGTSVWVSHVYCLSFSFIIL